MNAFVLVTDSGCDLPYQYLLENNILCVDLTYYFENSEEIQPNREVNLKNFYQRIRAGEIAKTSAVNPEEFKDVFRPIIEAGQDILYIGLDSALSTTLASARLAAEELYEEYPDSNILVVDPLCASAGLGMMVYEAQMLKEAGASIDEVYRFVLERGPYLSHRFTVDTLTYLQRGGRVSAAAALVGNVLNIRPVLHVDDEGSLIPLGKARGRCKSLEMIVEAYEQTAEDVRGGDIFISHADCSEDANKLAGMLKDRFGAKVTMITDIGPVIGSHSGPGTLALFFFALKR